MNNLLASLTALILYTACSHSSAAGDAIHQYSGTGKSGKFTYSVYNNRWLMLTDKDAKLAAITGVAADAKGDIVIPATINGFTVHGLDDNALASCKGVTGITLPATIKLLKPGTLNRCSGLERVVIDQDHPAYTSVDGILYNKAKTDLLFYGSGRAAEFSIPETIKTIGSQAFALCENLTSISIPKSVTDIGGRHGRVFEGCSNLERIELPATVTNLGQMSFKNCAKLIEFRGAGGLTEIPFGVFWNCPNLTHCDLTDGITSIGNYAFADCKKLTLTRLPAKLTKINAYAFKNCVSLKELSLPKGVTSTHNTAFRGCTELNLN